LDSSDGPPVVCGIDLGGTSTRLMVGDPAGQVLTELRQTTPHEVTTGGLVTWLADLVTELVTGLAGPVLAATAVGLPAAVHPATGEVRAAPNVPQLTGTAFTGALAAALPGITTFGNDTNAALAGELHAGAARGRRSAVMITIGTGLGTAVHLDGTPLTGRTGAIGEFGTLPYEDSDLEGAVSGSGMVRRARAAGFELDDAAPIFAADAPARLRAIRDSARAALTVMLTAVTAAYEPEIIVLGGGVAPAFADWYGPFRRSLTAITPEPPEITLGALGDPAGAIGSLVRAYRSLGTTVPDLRLPDLRLPDLRLPDLRPPDQKPPDQKPPDQKPPDQKPPDQKEDSVVSTTSA
jgi:glucokinase